MHEFHFLISEEYENERLDKSLCELTDDTVSRSYLQKLIKDNQVFVNQKVQKSSYRLKDGDIVSFTIPEQTEPDIIPEDLNLEILYEDQDVIVVNKPKDMVVHPAAGHFSHTLVNGLMFHCKDSLSGINGVLRPGIVHRIDKDTTGSIIACKNDNAHLKIAEQLKEHSITRRYRAICFGELKDDAGTIHAPIGRDEKDRKKMAINHKNGKQAITHYKVLERFPDYTYIECQLETGRTHQIRVHMASIGHPLLGDVVYSSRKQPFSTNGQVLHAYILGFTHPVNGEYIETTAPMPDYFNSILDKLRKTCRNV